MKQKLVAHLPIDNIILSLIKLKMQPIDADEKEIQEKVRSIKVFMSTYKRIENRHKSYEDPALRYTVLVDKFCLLIDFGLAAFLSYNSDLPTESLKEVEDMADSMSEELNSLLSWIRTPHYNPDHPVGNELMKSAQEHFAQ